MYGPSTLAQVQAHLHKLHAHALAHLHAEGAVRPPVVREAEGLGASAARVGALVADTHRAWEALAQVGGELVGPPVARPN